MSYLTALLLIVTSFVLASFISIIFCTRNPKSARNPPGPRPFPLIGNILELGTQPHKALAKLSETYGPMMTLKLGDITTVVISSPQAAKEVFQKNDHVFSYRTVPDSVRALDHHMFSVAWLPPSADQWKVLRKICASKVFSPLRLDSAETLRRRKVQEMLDHVGKSCKNEEALDIGKVVLTTVVNSISNYFFSVDLDCYTSEKSQEFKEIIWGINDEAGRPNVVDFFPVLSLLDPQRARARMNSYFQKLIAIFDGIIEERLRTGASEMESKDVLGTVMRLMMEENSQVSRLDVLHLFVDLFVAGIDTTSSTVEWAMAELLQNPEKLKKVREELRQVLKKDEQFEESHVSGLPFLRAVVKESLRLHPPIPLLLPHKAKEDVELCGFVVPRNAQVFINVGAIGRDSSVWENPNEFMPERFLESEVNFKGHDFELIPFGAGRRICPGLPLANRTLHMMLASLLHCYDWKLAGGLKAQDMDMSESSGLVSHKAIPLHAIPLREV